MPANAVVGDSVTVDDQGGQLGLNAGDEEETMLFSEELRDVLFEIGFVFSGSVELS